MTEIIGHDINGRPLRAGDEVVVADKELRHFGTQCRVLGTCKIVQGEVEVSIPFDGDEYQWYSALPEQLRKLHNDHRPANESFGEMMGKLSQGNASEGIRKLIKQADV